MNQTCTRLASALFAAGLLVAASHASAGAVIYNTGDATTATVAMGINDEGHLNTSTGSIVANSGATGLAAKFADGSWRDATSPGCYCEGWGVSVNGTTSGFANVSVDGVNNLSVDSFASTASTATSMVHLTSLPGLTVTHAYSPSDNAPGVLFKTVVTITNTTGATVNDLKYVRVMDWDVPPTEFSEFVTIKGTSATALEESGANGFNSANPLAGYSAGGYGCHDADCVDAGPADHGAYFRFNFGSLADGASFTFTTFYGAAATEAAALAALVAEGAGLYSFGQQNGDPAGGTPATFIFAFDGVGDPPVVPEPASMALLGIGALGLAMARRRKA